MKFEQDGVFLTYEDAFNFLKCSSMANTLCEKNINELKLKIIKTEKDYKTEKEWIEFNKVAKEYNQLLNDWFVKRISGELK